MNTRHRLIIAAALLGALLGLLLPVSAQHKVDNGLSNPVTVGTGGTGAKTAAGARTNLDVMSTSETGATAAAAVSAHNALSGAHNATALASEAKVASDISTHNLLSGAHNATTLASEAKVTSDISAHNLLSGAHNATTLASEAKVTSDIGAHNLLSGAHNATALASEAKVTADIAAHDILSSAHNSTTLASEAKVASDISDHNALNAAHGCTNVASEAALTAHTSAVAAHGCTNVASAAAVALKADLAGSSGQSFAADEIQADTIRSASGASTAITLSSAGQVAMARQSFARGDKTSQTVPNASLEIASYSADLDTLGELDASTGAMTVTETGVYVISAWADFGASTAGTYRQVELYADAVVIAADGAYVGESDDFPNTNIHVTISAIRYVTAGQAFRFKVAQDTGGNLLVGVTMTVSRIR